MQCVDARQLFADSIGGEFVRALIDRRVSRLPMNNKFRLVDPLSAIRGGGRALVFSVFAFGPSIADV